MGCMLGGCLDVQSRVHRLLWRQKVWFGFQLLYTAYAAAEEMACS